MMKLRTLSLACSVLAWAVACSPKAAATPGSTATPGSIVAANTVFKSEALVAQAEDILRAARQLDYRDPAAGKRIELRTKAANLYVEACKRTRDVSPCVWAISLSASIPIRRTDGVVRIRTAADALGARCLESPGSEACRIFDDMDHASYLSLYEQFASLFSEPGSLCDKGLAAACNSASIHAETDEAAVRLVERSCELGNRLGCSTLLSSLHDHHLATDMLDDLQAKIERAAAAQCECGYPYSCQFVPDKSERMLAAAIDGCARGYLHECNLWVGDSVARIPQLTQNCSLTGIDCAALAEQMRLDARPISMRDALEHACQLRGEDACVELVKGYQAKLYPEPVSGRMRSIVTYFCAPHADFGDFKGEDGFRRDICGTVRK